MGFSKFIVTILSYSDVDRMKYCAACISDVVLLTVNAVNISAGFNVVEMTYKRYFLTLGYTEDCFLSRLTQEDPTCHI